MLNQCNFIGNCGRDPETRYTKDGTPVASFSIAVSEKFKDRAGNQQETTEWVNVVAWNKLADIVSKYVHKGDKIFISGKMKTRDWTDKDGGKRKSTEIIAAAIELLGNRSGSPSSENRQQQAPQAQQFSDSDYGLSDDAIPF